MELCILLFKEYIICQDSNGGFKYKIKLKKYIFNNDLKIVRSQNLVLMVIFTSNFMFPRDS